MLKSGSFVGRIQVSILFAMMLRASVHSLVEVHKEAEQVATTQQVSTTYKPEVTRVEKALYGVTLVPQELLRYDLGRKEITVKELTTKKIKTQKVLSNPVTHKKGTLKTSATKKSKDTSGFSFPKLVPKSAKKYLEAAYKQALDACKDTEFPDPFMAMSLSVVEKPVENSEVFRIPLVYQDTLDRALESSDGAYATAIKQSSQERSYKLYACVGPLQMASGWVACERRNPTVWKDSCQMFYEDAELAVPGLTKFAEKCDIEVTDTLLRTLVAMRHNVGNLADWSKSNPNSSTGHSFIPFKTKRAVFEWNEAISSKKAQKAIKKSAYKAYLKYLDTGVYENEGIGWEKIAEITGYDKSNITSDKEWWRPLYSVRFWFNYYQLRLLYGVDTAETLGIE